MESTDEASECALLSLCLSDASWLDRQEFSVGLFTGERRGLAKTLIQLRVKGQLPNPENVQLVSKSEELGLLARKLNTRSIGGSFDLLVDRLKEVRARSLIAKVCKKGYDGAYNEEKEWRETLSELENDLSNLRGKQAVKNLSYAHDVQEVLDLIAWRNENPNAIRGYSTGLWKLDEVIDGINQELLYFCAARPSTGKAQPMNASLLTPDGFIYMKDVNVGDYVIGANGLPVQVKGVFHQGVKKTVRVHFSDGTSTRCCVDHLWFTQTRNERRRKCKGSVKTTLEIMNTIKRPDGGNRNHTIPWVKPVHFESQGDLPMNPWLLGALIGDGKLGDNKPCFFKPEQDMQDRVTSLLPGDDYSVKIEGGIRINGGLTRAIIAGLGLNVNSEFKFIPREYLYSSPEDRLLLLQGLCDTDGFVTKDAVEYSTSSKRLAEDMIFLARSLGASVSVSWRTPKYTYKGEKLDGLPSCRIFLMFSNGLIPVSSEKHLSKWDHVSRLRHKSIVAIDDELEEECQCISVDSNDGLYVTDDFIVTHNTSIALQILLHVAEQTKKRVVFCSAETSASLIKARCITILSGVPIGRIGRSHVPKEQRLIKEAVERFCALDFVIDDKSSPTITHSEAGLRRLSQEAELAMVAGDYFQLWQGIEGKKYQSKYAELCDVSVSWKAIAKQFRVPVLMLAQLQRPKEGVYDREQKRTVTPPPQIHEIKECGGAEQDADGIWLLHRNQQENSTSAELIVGKNRDGPLDKIKLTFTPQLYTFTTS